MLGKKKFKKRLSYEHVQNEDIYKFDIWKSEVKKFLTQDRVERMYIEDKHERYAYLDQMKKEFAAEYQEKIDEAGAPQSVIDYIFDDEFQEKLSDLIFNSK